MQDSDGNAITALSIAEGGEASYQIKLASQPEQDVEVCIGLSVRDNNDADITFKGEANDVVAIKLPFTPENWNTAQTVTLVAAEDNDYVNGARDLVIDAREYYSGKVELAVTEIDNDEMPPAAPTGLTATAGDGSVTLTWNNPSDASLTGYELRSRVAPPAPGWGAWTAIANSDADTTSHTVTGLENGNEYRFKLRAVNAGGASKPGPQSAPWYVAATPFLPAPSNVAVNPGEDSLEITWDAVREATSYDVRAKAEDASDWHDVASGVTGTSYTYTTSNTMDYVGVRARNANGASAWGDVSRMPSDDLLRVATGLSSGNASAQSGGSIASQLAAPTWGTITRKVILRGKDKLNGLIEINWTDVSGATGYNVVCTDTNGWAWHLCGWINATNSDTVTYTSVPAAQSQPVTVSHYRRGSESPHQPGDYVLKTTRSYKLAIRAVNNDPSQASPWTETVTIPPVLKLVVSNIGVYAANLTVAGYDGQWWYKANVGKDRVCRGPVAAGMISKALDGLYPNASFNYKAYSADGCASADLIASASSFTTLSSIYNILNDKGSAEKNVTASTDRAFAFTTGSNSGGFSLGEVILELSEKTAGGTLRATLRTAESNLPSLTVLATLTGTAPTGSSWTEITYTCSGSGCNLSAGETYFIVLENTADTGAYSWAWTTDSSTTKTPSNSGWSIGTGYVKSGAIWTAETSYHLAEAGFRLRP